MYNTKLTHLVEKLKALNEDELYYILIDFVYDDTNNQGLHYLADKIAETKNIDACNDEGITALMFAVAFGLIEIIQLLIEAGSDVNKQMKTRYTALMLASELGEHEIVELLINAHANIFLMQNDETALMKAVQKSHISIVKQLIENGRNELLQEKLCVFNVSNGPAESVYVLLDTDLQINRALIYALDSRYIFDGIFE